MDDQQDENITPIVPVTFIRCHRCGSRSHRQYGREGKLRYHRCKECGLRYKSWENQEHFKQSWFHPE